MKRLNADIESTAASLFNYSRTFGPHDTNLGGYRELIMTHSNQQPTSAPGPLNPKEFNDGAMADPVAASMETNPRIITPARVNASFSLPEYPNVVFAAPRQHAFAFYLKTKPVQGKTPMRQSATQKAFNAQYSGGGGERMPIFSLDPFYKNVLSAILQHKAATEDYEAYSEIAGDMLYNGPWKFSSPVDDAIYGTNDANNYYNTNVSRLGIFKNFNGWSCMDGVTMVNETYNGQEPMQSSFGNTVLHGLNPVVESYHEMTQCMRGVYQMYNYWGRAGTVPGASLYWVEKKFGDDEYRDGIKEDGFLNFSLGRSNGQGYVETFECPINAKLRTPGKRFKDDAGAGRDHIRPMLMAPVAIASGGPLPREYLRYEDDEGRKRYGHHVYAGQLMRPSYFAKDATKQLRPSELRPVMDSRSVNNKEVIHVYINPDDCLHTIV